MKDDLVQDLEPFKHTATFTDVPVPKSLLNDHSTKDGVWGSNSSRWLDLFYETLREAEGQRAATELVGSRARMIADSLLTGIVLRRDGLAGGRAGKELPHV